MKKVTVKNPEGKLGVLIVGLGGAVSTTFIAGLHNILKGYGKPFGSLTQMATIRIGERTENNFPFIKDYVSLSKPEDIVIGGWEIRNNNCYEAAKEAKVLESIDLDSIVREMERIEPMSAVFDKYYVKRLDGDFVKRGKNKKELAEQLRDDIKKFKELNNLERVVVIWCASTEIFISENEVHKSLANFEKGMLENNEDISPSMLYAYAALSEGVPFINGAPNLSVEIPALLELAEKTSVPVAGKDFKTGQTLIKTVIAPMLKARMLGLEGWFSTNLLGNKDGVVLDEPGSFKTKEESKLSVLNTILQPELYPDLYKDFYHKVRINYYPPRGDNKEGWDNIDIFGWLGYPMQLKVNFLCKDSILAAPLVLDLILFMDLAQRAGMKGIQEWLSFYFKSPNHSPNIIPEHDLFIQQMKLKNTLRTIMNEEPITHIDTDLE
ncbi:MAG: inositol-3-phosphate synthase [Bacteroidetes bacterium]|nr:inositol-3-phosphate synthase [Bacteroidota bacterium]